jgi:hypothetical protein
VAIVFSSRSEQLNVGIVGLQGSLSAAFWLASLHNSVVWVFDSMSPQSERARAAMTQAAPGRVRWIAHAGNHKANIAKFLKENSELKVSLCLCKFVGVLTATPSVRGVACQPN